MAKTTKRAARWVPPARNLLQLKITLRYISPRIWRRVVVPDNYTLGDLHQVIQAALGWYNCHLHAFRFGAGFRRPIEYTAPAAMTDGDPLVRDEDSVLLGQVIQRERQTFTYEYDFGDTWLHEVLTEKITPSPEPHPRPVVLAGERACPPEDCGGVPGYTDLLRALRSPKTPDDEDLRKWAGHYDPERFDLKAVNQRFQS
jgi:hypothetical protein